MTHRIIAATLVSFVAATHGAFARQDHAPMPPGMTHAEHLAQMAKDADLKKRGADAMGFDQDAAAHRFRLLADGGAIEVSARDAADVAVRDAIRAHLRGIAAQFSQGVFDKPVATHAEVPPGVDTMQALKERITYAYEQTDDGGRVRITTGDAAALAAIHAFLTYQIKEHGTGDPPRAPDGPRFDLPANDVLIDDVIPIVVSGLTPHATVAIQLRSSGQDKPWTSDATFVADGDGRVDLTHAAPIKSSGGYTDADPMGLFWSAQRKSGDKTTPVSAASDDEEESGPNVWTLTAEVNGSTVARATVRRRAVAANVRVRPVREAGLVGTFFEPPDGGRHPAFLVLGGSNGGLPPASGPAGGLASRGYSVLALAYFGAEGLPRSLSNIPLEYLGTALRWLAAQPSVDANRMGVLGGSRGAELALLLGAVSPGLRVVIAYMPSNVVWRGCCDPSAQIAWTVGGRPVATMPAAPLRQPLQAMQAEIPVERINGAVLLVSGRDDGVWASTEMAGKVMARLKKNGFAHPAESLVYDKTGHAIGRPYTSTMDLNSRRHPISGRLVQMGGTPAGTAKAREDSWRKVLAFADQNLRGGA